MGKATFTTNNPQPVRPCTEHNLLPSAALFTNKLLGGASEIACARRAGRGRDTWCGGNTSVKTSHGRRLAADYAGGRCRSRRQQLRQGGWLNGPRLRQMDHPFWVRNASRRIENDDQGAQ